MGTSAYRPIDALPRVGHPPAAYIQRIGAAITDGIIVFALVMVPVFMYTWIGPGDVRPCSFVGDVEVCNAPEARELLVNRLLFYSLLTVFVLRYSWQIGRSGQTIGKRSTACMVVDARTQQTIGFGRALLRTLAMAVSALPWGLGFLWPLWDPQRRAFHDIIARTRVVSP